MAQEPVRLEYRYLPAEPIVSDSGRKLDLKVIFTDLRKTAAALATARTMARGLGARITLLVAQVVPYPLPLSAPDVPVEFTEQLLESVAAGDETTVEIFLCRDRWRGLIRSMVPPDSVVIIGARKRRWWPGWLLSWERNLTNKLRHDGRRVLVVTL